MRQLSLFEVVQALTVTALVAAGCTPASTKGISGAGGGAGATPGGGGANGTGAVNGSGGGGPGTGGGVGGAMVFGVGGAGDPDAGASGGAGGSTVMKMACVDAPYGDPYTPGYTQSSAVTAQVQTLLATMSLSDKAGQMRGTSPGTGQFTDIFRTLDNTTRGIKGFLFRDGPRGVNMDAQLPSGALGGRSTVFPVAIARGAAWDLDLEFRIGQAMGDEMVAAGQTMLLAPTTNILRHPLWGRAQETYGEDPFQLGRLGSALVAGIQQYVPACAKHYAGNNIENGRASLNAMMDEQTLREIYGRHFEMMIKDGGVACIMAAYNSIDGVKSTQNAHLLNDILRTDFGFKGFVLSDWWAMPGGTVPTLATAVRSTNAAQAVSAGLDMELPWALNFSQIESITGAGLPLSDALVNTAVGRILEQKIRFKVNALTGTAGLKASSSTFAGGVISGPTVNGEDAHIALAREAALKSITLLKNCPMASLNCTVPTTASALPIKAPITSVAVIGANLPYQITSADPGGGMINWVSNVRTGDWGSSRVLNDPAKSVGPLAGIQAAGARNGITVTTGSSAAMVGSAQFVVVVVGLTPQDEGEEYTGAGDRASFALDAKANNGVQNGLITAVAALGKPMVVVLEGGSVIDMPWLAQVPAVVMAWYPGMVGGTALGQLLFGEANFSGKLPITWGASLSQYPTFNAGATTTMDYDLGYRRFDRMNVAPLFPFGYGLSYTTFQYSNLVVPCGTVTKNGVVNISVDVINTGTVDGSEVVQLYVSYPDSTKRRPIKELKAFARTVTLHPGQGQHVPLPVRVSDLKYWDMTSNSWQVETGAVKISVGPSSASLPLTDTMMVQ